MSIRDSIEALRAHRTPDSAGSRTTGNITIGIDGETRIQFSVAQIDIRDISQFVHFSGFSTGGTHQLYVTLDNHTNALAATISGEGALRRVLESSESVSDGFATYTAVFSDDSDKSGFKISSMSRLREFHSLELKHNQIIRLIGLGAEKVRFNENGTARVVNSDQIGPFDASDPSRVVARLLKDPALMASGGEALSLVDSVETPVYRVHRFDQTIHGVPVMFGTTVYENLANSRIERIKSNFLPAHLAPTLDGILGSEEARKRSIEAARSGLTGLRTDASVSAIEEPELIFENHQTEAKARLTWRTLVEIATSDQDKQTVVVVIDAHSAKSEVFETTKRVTRRIYNAAGSSLLPAGGFTPLTAAQISSDARASAAD